jgi:hypothetical protein
MVPQTIDMVPLERRFRALRCKARRREESSAWPNSSPTDARDCAHRISVATPLNLSRMELLAFGSVWWTLQPGVAFTEQSRQGAGRSEANYSRRLTCHRRF